MATSEFGIPIGPSNPIGGGGLSVDDQKALVAFKETLSDPKVWREDGGRKKSKMRG